MSLGFHYELHRNGLHPGLGQAITPFSTTHGTAAFAVTTAGTIAASLTPFIGAMAAIPGLGPLIAAGTALVGVVINMFQGCGSSCTLTSQAADQVEAKIKPLFAAYMSGGHTQSEQAAYLAAFDQFWAALVQYCGQPSFGSAGQRCTQDRESGSCKWTSSAWGWVQSGGTWTFVPSGAAGSGSQCWNWVDYYRGSVANDPTVVPDPSSLTSLLTGGTSTTPGVIGTTNSPPMDYTPMLLALALIVAAVML